MTEVGNDLHGDSRIEFLEQRRVLLGPEQFVVGADGDDRRPVDARDLTPPVAAELEARVLARTQDLDKALGELTAANGRLQELSQRDALTSLHNRQFLAERMPEIWGMAVRWKQPLAMLMIEPVLRGCITRAACFMP